jgi:hypothetical protein
MFGSFNSFICPGQPEPAQPALFLLAAPVEIEQS